jgi:hypothetical protein
MMDFQDDYIPYLIAADNYIVQCILARREVKREVSIILLLFCVVSLILSSRLTLLGVFAF